MGQKVSGYRRKVPYGTKTVTRDREQEPRSWMFRVNPKGRVGWNLGDAGRTEADYGEEVNRGHLVRQQIEECRKGFGCVSNGRGRKGTWKTGYQVYGEYTYGDREDRWASGVESKDNVKENPEEFRQRRQEARLRLSRKLAQERQVRVERNRVDLKRRREGNPAQREEKKERKARRLPGRKREKPGERVDAVVLSGSRPIQERRAKLIANELEAGIHHLESRRKVEKLRKAKTKLAGGRPKDKGQGTGPYGYQIQAKGPLGGARRTRVYLIQEGKLPLGSTQGLTRTSLKHAKTSIGTIGVKVTYCYGLG